MPMKMKVARDGHSVCLSLFLPIELMSRVGLQIGNRVTLALGSGTDHGLLKVTRADPATTPASGTLALAPHRSGSPPFRGRVVTRHIPSVMQPGPLSVARLVSTEAGTVVIEIPEPLRAPRHLRAVL